LNFQQECSWADAESSCDSDRPEFLDTYDGAIRYVDTSILHLLAQLKQSGVLQNTLVVFTSDHGQEFGNHGIYGHGKSLYLGEIHVPLIFWKPGMVPASVRVPTPVSTSDIAATVLDLAAPDGKQVLPGSSLTALWRSSQPVSSWPEPISELARLHWFSKQAPNYNQPVSSIVTPQWQYIHQEDKDFLFDWKTDPHETIDLCSSKPIVCSELKARSQATRESRTQEHDHMDLSSASKAGQVRLPNAPPQSVIWKKWS
jgi:arylsulfatase A-like enzyme